MSGHNKWSKIKTQKGAADKQRSALFSKCARAITVSAKEGGNPVFNFKLRLAIDRARAANMPKDAIERAIARGTGEAGGAIIETVLYEGFAPGGPAVLIECLTDNRNRAHGAVRTVFVKRGGNLGSEGSVRWQFEQRGIVRIDGELTDGQELACIEAGAEDIRRDEDGASVVTAVENLQKVQEAIEAAGITVADAGLDWLAKQEVQVSNDDREMFEAFIEMLEEIDDVQEVYTNAK